jgi:hypothetical protein
VYDYERERDIAHDGGAWKFDDGMFKKRKT